MRYHTCTLSFDINKIYAYENLDEKVDFFDVDIFYFIMFISSTVIFFKNIWAITWTITRNMQLHDQLHEKLHEASITRNLVLLFM